MVHLVSIYNKYPFSGILLKGFLSAKNTRYSKKVHFQKRCTENLFAYSSTGLFIASGYFDTPLNSWQDGPILMPFEWVNKPIGWFVLRYNNAWYMAKWL